MYLRHSRRNSPSLAMRSFINFFLCSSVAFVIQTNEISYFRCKPFFRSSHRRCSVKQLFLKISRKFTGKYLCQSPFIKKEALAQVVSCEFCGIFKNTFFYITTPPLAASDSSDSNYSTQINTEAVTQRCSIKQVLLKLSADLHESICDGASFSKVAGLSPASLLKKRPRPLWVFL